MIAWRFSVFNSCLRSSRDGIGVGGKATPVAGNTTGEEDTDGEGREVGEIVVGDVVLDGDEECDDDDEEEEGAEI